MASFKTVKYTKEYQYRGISEWITSEMALNEGDDAKQALHTCKNLVEEFWAEISPEHNGSVVPTVTKQEPQSTEAGTIAAIYTCTEIKVLKSYQMIAKKYPTIQAAYDQQMKKLTA
jgi:hypothetical protein